MTEEIREEKRQDGSSESVSRFRSNQSDFHVFEMILLLQMVYCNSGDIVLWSKKRVSLGVSMLLNTQRTAQSS